MRVFEKMDHPQNTQFELMLEAQAESNETASYDVGFIHRSLCIAALPHRRPASHKGSVATFERRGKGWALQMVTPDVEIPDSGVMVPIGVPFGTRARLLVIWLASQARQSSSRCIEIGPIKNWLREIGAGCGGDAANVAKEQLIRISHTSFNIAVRDSFLGEDSVVFKRESFISGSILATEDLLHYKEGAMNQVRWPTGVVLTETAWSRFRNESVAIPMHRLREISDSAAAIDVFLYFSYMLPLIPLGEDKFLSWRQYHTQFGAVGAEHRHVSKIRANAQPAIAAALRAYPEAQVQVTEDGLVLLPSRPADFSPTMVSLATPEMLALRRKRHEVKMT